MKRLLVVLFGVLVFQGSVWAECPDAKVLSPGENSVLIKDLPFVLQWQDDDLCLGKQVKIDLIDDNGKHIAYEESKKDYKVKRLNSGFLIIYQFKAPPSDQKYHFKISPTQISKRTKTIESKPFSVITSKQHDIRGSSLVRSSMSNPLIMTQSSLDRVLLARIVALEETIASLHALAGGGGTVGVDDGTSKEGAEQGDGECIHDVFPCGTPWRKVVDAGQHQNHVLQACWCKGPGDPDTGYCDEEGWMSGPNKNGSFAASRNVANFGISYYAGHTTSQYLCRRR